MTSISATRGHTQASAGTAKLCELGDTLQTRPNFLLNSFPLGTFLLSYKVATEDLCVCCQIVKSTGKIHKDIGHLILEMSNNSSMH